MDITPPSEKIIRLKLWLEGAGGVGFGMGRLMLLQAVHESGSLNAAAKSLGMSYRAAWGKLKVAEEVLGFSLLEKLGGSRSSYTLTAEAMNLLESFKAWMDEVETYAVARAAVHFPFPTARYDSNNIPGKA